MGTNYYYYPEKDGCEHCGRGPQPPLHIGKSSYGWVFSLHVNLNVYDYATKDLTDWTALFDSGGIIRDEYDDIISKESMLKIITERVPINGQSELRRHDIDIYHCIGHGSGSYDYCVGEFS